MAVLVIVAATSTAAAAPDRCAAGLKGATAGDLVVAFLDLDACIEAGAGGAEHRAAHREVKRALDDGEFALVTLAVTPAGAPVSIAPLGAVAVTGRAYLPPGRYTLKVTYPNHRPLSRELEITGRYRETIELVLASDRKTIGSSTVDLTAEPAPTSIARGKDPEHENLIPDRFRAGQPKPMDAPPPARSRWPYVVLGVGLAAAGAGILLQLDDRPSAATGFFIGGGAAAAAGITGLVLRW